jgi:hypothetical protein
VERRGISTVRTVGLTVGIVVAALGTIAAVAIEARRTSMSNSCAATSGRPCEDCYQVRPTILNCKLSVSRWHEQIGDPILADGILDRLVHNAHRFGR